MRDKKQAIQEDISFAVLRTRSWAEIAIDDVRTRMDGALSALLDRAPALEHMASKIVACLRQGHTVLIAGNGGSAAEAQHFVAELVGRFKIDRDPYSVLALTSDSAVVTAIANDYGYHQVFARQVAAVGRRGDLLILFSTSGESHNLLEAARVARELGISVIAITGSRPSRLAEAADFVLRMPTDDSCRVQELHMVVTHVLCEFVERELMEASSGPVETPQETAVQVGA